MQKEEKRGFVHISEAVSCRSQQMRTSPLKMQAIALPLQGLISAVKDNANTVAFSVLVFSYQALQNEFPCSCKPQVGYCTAYIIIPCLIITVLMLSTNWSFQRAGRYTASTGSCHFCCVLFRGVVKALCVGLLWVASVFIDAEWTVCCLNQNPRPVADLQCKAKQEITPGGTPVVTIAEMKMNSRVIGMSLLFGVVVVGAILLSTWRICADSCCFSKCCGREVEVHELLLEVGEEVVPKTIKEQQQSQISDKVKKFMAAGNAVDCLYIVEGLIKNEGIQVQQQHKNTSQQSDDEHSF